MILCLPHFADEVWKAKEGQPVSVERVNKGLSCEFPMCANPGAYRVKAIDAETKT